jgi:hypothetical protein
MANVLQIYDCGITQVKGNPRGVILFKISTDTGAAEEMIAYCHVNYRDTIIKNLKRLSWQKPEQAPQAEAGHGIDAEVA